MAAKYGISEEEFKKIQEKASHRAELRRQFIMQSTNPHKHAAEAGHVFDPAIQRYLSMRVAQFQLFQPNWRTSLIGICTIVLPMLGYGYIVWNDRNKKELAIRSGELCYRDRTFKFA